MQKHKKLRARILSLALTAAMVFTTMPATVFATEGNATLGTSNIECHVEHDKDCGYKEAVEGADCSHKNKDGTYSCASDTVSDNTATPGDADRTTCTHEDDCGYVEAVAGADCKHTCEKCEVKDSGAADKQTAYDKVVDLFTALPAASVINRTTTQEEKDAVIAQLTAAMDAFDALTADEQALFMKEQAALYKAAMALNDAITGARPLTLTTGVIPPFVEGTNKRYKNGETFKLSELKAGDRIEVGAICNESNSLFNFDSYELFLTGGGELESGPFGQLAVGGTPTAISDRYPNSNINYKGDATHVTTRVEWILYDVDSGFFVSPDKTVQHEYDVTVNKNGLTGAAAKFEIELAEGNKLVEGDSFKVADYDTVLVTITPDGGGSFKATPTVAVDSGATAGTVTKGTGEEYTCEITSFTGNTTITVAGTAEVSGGATDSDKLNQAKPLAEAAITGITATNSTTAANILDAVTSGISSVDGVTASWKAGSPTITPATKDNAGSITGTIVLTSGSETVEVAVNKVIAKLTADKSALNAAIAEANNAKSGITTNNASDPSSVSSGIKYVSDTEMKALTDAIAAAQTVANNTNATTAEVNAAVTALKTAVDTFKAVIKTGTYTSGGGDGGGGGGGGGGGSSSTSPSGGSAGGVTTPGKTVIDNPVGNQGSKNTLAEAVKNAIATGKTNSTVFTNFANYTALTKDGLKAINDATVAAIAGKNVQLSTKVQLDNKVGNAVVSRITIDPVKLATVMPDKLGLGIWFDQKQDRQVTAVKEKFERAFDNNMVIVTFEQKDPLKVDMEFAAKPDLSKLNTQTLYFYSYNPTTNLYYRILSPDYWVDKNGYTHFTAPFGGSVVISDKPLTKK